MKVFELSFLSDEFQWVVTSENDRRLLKLMKPQGAPKLASWKMLDLKSAEPTWPVGLFYQWLGGEFILSQSALSDSVLLALLSVDGEFLPVRVDSIGLPMHNITGFADCLDSKLSGWRPKLEDLPDGIEFPRFIPEKTPKGTMFRLREYPGPRYVATDPSLPAEKDFYQWYYQQGYQGLKFRLMWDSDQPDQLIRFW